MATVEIIDNSRITPCIFKMVLKSGQIAGKAKPGQFVNLRIVGKYYPLLRRPMSIYYAEMDRFAIIYTIRGIGTGLLSKYKNGDSMDILGPLGIPFESLLSTGVDKKSPFREKLYLIAGGVGIAPLYFLYKKSSAFLIIGAKNRDGILPTSELEHVGEEGKSQKSNVKCQKEQGDREGRSKLLLAKREEGKSQKSKVKCQKEKGDREEGKSQKSNVKSRKTRTTNTDIQIVTEDGSVGRKGLVTDYLPDVSDGSFIVACGPVPMLKRVKEFYSKKRVNCILSMESRMGCGYGVCLSCAVKTIDGYRYVCKDGPAFRAEDVEFD
ncbi:dihydroorotate dehydrogenase electron transfer subunit [candidate division WOR-3 bacterium]|nr:dihydroorotate dehydrogenase electron transfer subunit [candidate division WOR-3 bacterium]